MIVNGAILLGGIVVGMIVYYCGYESGYSNGHERGCIYASAMMTGHETEIQQKHDQGRDTASKRRG